MCLCICVGVCMCVYVCVPVSVCTVCVCTRMYLVSEGWVGVYVVWSANDFTTLHYKGQG